MKKLLILTLITMSVNGVVAQNFMSPELLWKLGRISPLGISKDEKNIIYKVSTPSVDENKSNSKYYSIPVNGGTAIEISEYILRPDEQRHADTVGGAETGEGSQD